MFLVSGFVFSMAGCGKVTEHAQPSPTMPEVTLVKAETRNILRTMGQPGFVEAYEQTSIFSKRPISFYDNIICIHIVHYNFWHTTICIRICF